VRIESGCMLDGEVQPRAYRPLEEKKEEEGKCAHLPTCRRPETSPSNDENLTIIPRLLAKTNRKVGVAADTKPAPVCLCVPENNGFEPSHPI
jgi:hypothetical protein